MTNNQFSKQDRKYMTMALHEAEQALAAGDYPVGAVLTINGELVGQARNGIFSDTQSTSHAEMNLLRANSAQIRQLVYEGKGKEMCLYTTLEPCLMCLGTAVLHRITRIVIACPDPHGGATRANPGNLGSFYSEHWPQIESGLMKEESVKLIFQFLRTKKFLSWETMAEQFTKMEASW
jgi:tRNA(adenine34) deaminase